MRNKADVKDEMTQAEGVCPEHGMGAGAAAGAVLDRRPDPKEQVFNG